MTSIHTPNDDVTPAAPVLPDEIATGQPFSPESTPVDGVPVVSDAELEKQALAHPGADGDPSTPE